MTVWRELREAAALVVSRWDSGDLAGAVRRLDAALRELSSMPEGKLSPAEGVARALQLLDAGEPVRTGSEVHQALADLAVLMCDGRLP